MKFILISGGDINRDFALDFLRKQKDARLIAVDKGMQFCYENKIAVDAIVGDFDSVDEISMDYFEKSGIPIKRLRPEKDDSDTQSALQMAVDMGAEQIEVLGATGTRIDHLWANVQLLLLAKKMGIEMSIWDAYNYISVREESFSINREEQFGKYVSFFSMGDCVPDVTLRGFKYPLNGHYLTNMDCGLSLSNEIIDKTAYVSFSSGMLLMIQSRD